MHSAPYREDCDKLRLRLERDCGYGIWVKATCCISTESLLWMSIMGFGFNQYRRTSLDTGLFPNDCF